MSFKIRVRIGALGLGLVLLGVALRAQTASVMGTVTRRHHHEPVKGVVVVIAGKSSITDISGRYRIDDVPIGPQRMQIIKGNRVLLSVEVTINAGSILNQELH